MLVAIHTVLLPYHPHRVFAIQNNSDESRSQSGFELTKLEGALKVKQFKSSHMAVCQSLVPLVNIKIAGKWMFIPLKMVLIGIDP